jgi:DNA-binding CsgD family transcriptional regulator
MRSRSERALSDGQIACLQLIAQNLTSKEIAVRLGISRHTVDERVRRALRVLDAPNRRQAARLVQGRPRHWHRLEQKRPPHTPSETKGLQIQAPFATALHPVNTMSVIQRLCWIFGISLAALIASCVYLAGLESFGRLMKH